MYNILILSRNSPGYEIITNSAGENLSWQYVLITN